MTDARTLYERLTDDLLYDPAVGRSTMMGHPCVRRAGRFFASFDTRAEALVVKLPRQRVGELIADGTGEPFAAERPRVSRVGDDPGSQSGRLGTVARRGRDFAAPAQRERAGFDEDLADRIRDVLADLGIDDVREQKMFGGLAFLAGGHMTVATRGEGGLLVSIDQGDRDTLLRRAHPTHGHGRAGAGRLAAR